MSSLCLAGVYKDLIRLVSSATILYRAKQRKPQSSAAADDKVLVIKKKLLKVIGNSLKKCICRYCVSILPIFFSYNGSLIVSYGVNYETIFAM